jgi:hypothetical protein
MNKSAAGRGCGGRHAPAAGRAWAAALLLAGLAGPAAAQVKASEPTGIYTCIDEKGRRLTADRPIPECVAKEQHILNRDGSVKSVRPPTLTPDERADREAQERKAAEARAAQADAVRLDRNLKARYPNEATHLRAREAAIESVRQAIKASEQRLKDLAAERKPLQDESEFYVGRPMPAKLKAQMDANEVATEAQKNALANQQAEMVRINRFYDVELDRLRKLWAGAMPGSLGPMESAAASAPNATR